jgi:hypothetical protein
MSNTRDHFEKPGLQKEELESIQDSSEYHYQPI